MQSTATTSGTRKAAAPGDEAAPRRPTLLLDIDGTLCRTDAIYQLTFKELLAPYGYEVDETWYKANVHGGVDAEVFKRLMPDDYTAEQLADVGKQKDTLFCKKVKEVGLPLIAGIDAALKMVRECGMRCIAVTNAPRPAAELVLVQLCEECEAGDVIEDLVIGAECPQAKPHADPYLIAMERSGAQPEDCIVFEDSRSGVRAGVAATVAAVVGIRSELDDEALREAGATVTVADWIEVTREMLDGLIKCAVAAARRRLRRARRRAWPRRLTRRRSCAAARPSGSRLCRSRSSTRAPTRPTQWPSSTTTRTRSSLASR